MWARNGMSTYGCDSTGNFQTEVWCLIQVPIRTETDTSMCACTCIYMCNLQPDRCLVLLLSGVVLMCCFYRIFDALSKVFFLCACISFFIYLCIQRLMLWSLGGKSQLHQVFPSVDQEDQQIQRVPHSLIIKTGFCWGNCVNEITWKT
jgi:hypothetical protein